MIKLLVTDLDDTLYHWMDFFVPAFYGMVDEVVRITGLDKERLLAEYRQKHQEYGSVEFPYITLKLPSLLAKYPGANEDELKHLFKSAFQKFNTIRDRELKLFEGVEDTLKALCAQGVTIIGFTESSQENGFYRLGRLGVSQYFKHVYALESQFQNGYPPDEKVRTIRTRKPDKAVLLQICAQENCGLDEVLYVGDNLAKDVYMAHLAGVRSVWADHPKAQNDYPQMLLAVTSWTPEDYARDMEIRRLMQEQAIRPDYTIHSYRDLLSIIQSL